MNSLRKQFIEILLKCSQLLQYSANTLFGFLVKFAATVAQSVILGLQEHIRGQEYSKKLIAYARFNIFRACKRGNLVLN